MAQTSAQIKAAYPLPVYNYRVTVLDAGELLAIGFTEVSGLSLEYEPVTYKHGLSFVMGSRIIPGMRQEIKLTLKKGVVKGNEFIQSWFHRAYADPFFKGAKRDIMIDLCDETGASAVRWKVQGALPIRLEAPAFDANSNDVAIETMEIVAHGLQLDHDF